MRLLLNFVALVLFLPGLTFLLQGINVLPGSYMSGDLQWAINGGIIMAIAIGLAVFANRRK